MAGKENFNHQVFQIVQLIPKGRVTSYGAIARSLGMPKMARQVGWALNKVDSFNEYVPAHRVVNRMGKLTAKGRFDGEQSLIELLGNEGINVIEDQIQNFDSCFWDPSIELSFE